jgi:hypothetical protein
MANKKKKPNIFHKHLWVESGGIIMTKTRYCKCSAIQTLLYDRSTDQEIWVDGLITNGSRDVLVLAGNFSQFHQAQRLIVASTSIDRHHVVYATFDSIRSVRDVDVYFYGTWWENDDYQSEEMTLRLNRLFHPFGKE